MIIPGHGDSLPEAVDVDLITFDGADLMGEPEFWAAYCLNQSIEDDSLLARAWAVEVPSIREMQRALWSPDAWPTFEVPIDGGSSLVVVFRNVEDDSGVDYLVVPPGGRDCIRVATLEGGYQGPGISWDEVLRVANRAADPLARAQRMLLLAPALGDVEVADSGGVDMLADALRAVGVQAHSEEVAELIATENLQWEPVEWRTTEGGIRVCASEESPRSMNSAVSLSDEQLRVVSELLAG